MLWHRWMLSHSISIHAPPRGATRRRPTTTREDEFQFTPLREGRRAMRGDSGTSDDIAIHAPPRGATPTSSRHKRRRHFNSRPSARGDGKPFRARPALADFNSRPSARGDQKLLRILGIETEFQFTPLREGRRELATLARKILQISIHAPPRGATSSASCREDIPPEISIHAPPRGATRRCKR